MKELMQKIAHELHERVWLAWKSTLLGIALAAVIVVLDQVTTYLQALPKGWAPVAATLVALLCASLRRKAAEAVTNPPAPSAGGYARVFLLLGIALGVVAGLTFAATARGDDGQPSALGGVFKVGTVSAAYGPRLLPGMLALDFKTGDVAVVSIGGLAYGCDFFADKPYSIGGAVFLGAQVGKDATPSAISTGVVATLFHYAVLGWHHGITGGVKSDHFVAGPSVAF